jgi:hypothetical protein
MARAHEPSNGSDHPTQNGVKGKQVAIALFIATTFGIMAILSFPLSKVVRLPITLPRPLQAALAPAERLIRPIIPWLGNPLGTRPPTLPVAHTPTAPGVSPSVPSGPGGPGGPGSGPPPPPGGEGSPTLPSALTRPGQPIPPTLVKELTTILSTLSKRLSPEEARLVRAELAWLRPMREACLADRACAKQLKRLEKLLRKFEARQRQRGRHGDKHRHAHGNESTQGPSRSSETTSDGGERGHGKHKKQGKHHKKHGGLKKG